MTELTQDEMPRFDAYQDTEISKSLEKVAEELARAPDDPYSWKWALIALHNAMQATIVRAIAGGDGSGALDKKSQQKLAAEFRARIEGNASIPDAGWPRLAGFMELYERCKERRPHAARAPELEADVGRLDWIRGELIHYKPSNHLTLLLAEWPQRTLRCLDFIESLMPGRPTGGAQWLYEHDGELAERSLGRARERAKQLDARYNRTRSDDA